MMADTAWKHYFDWLTKSTETLFWHDSAIPAEIAVGIERGAMGITCNPPIAMRCINADREGWKNRARTVRKQFPGIGLEEWAWRMINETAHDAAKMIRPVYDKTKGKLGYVAGQVDPSQIDEAEPMLRQALEVRAYEPNMGVKIPATEAGMTVIEELAAKGVVTISTVSFSVAQAIAAQEAYERGRARSGKAGNVHLFNYSVMIIGRLDEYLVAKTEREKLDIPRDIVEMAGLAVTKKINRIFKERDCKGMCLIGGTRLRHVSGLAGSRMSMTINKPTQDQVIETGLPYEARGNDPLPDEVIALLRKTFPEFNKAYDEDGLSPSEFTSFPPCREMHDWFLGSFSEIQQFLKGV
jgi:transaldolase